MHKAALSGSLAKVKKLLKRGAEIDAVWSTGITPLGLAVDEGHFEVVSYLLEEGASAFAVDSSDGRTLLHDAANRGYTHILKLLLDFGLDPNALSQKGMKPLHYAAGGEVTLTTTVVLLGLDPDINHQDRSGYTPLAYAALHSNFAAAYLLVQSGADRSLKIASGETPYDLASSALNSFRNKSGKISERFSVEKRYLEEIMRITKP